MRISDWSSDVCSSDLRVEHPGQRPGNAVDTQDAERTDQRDQEDDPEHDASAQALEVGARLRLRRQALVGAKFRQPLAGQAGGDQRSEEHTSELQSLMRISYAVFCLKKKNTNTHKRTHNQV